MTEQHTVRTYFIPKYKLIDFFNDERPTVGEAGSETSFQLTLKSLMYSLTLH